MVGVPWKKGLGGSWRFGSRPYKEIWRSPTVTERLFRLKSQVCLSHRRVNQQTARRAHSQRNRRAIVSPTCGGLRVSPKQVESLPRHMPLTFSVFLAQLATALQTENGPDLAFLLRPTSPHGKDLLKELRSPTVRVHSMHLELLFTRLLVTTTTCAL